jgi:large subunit ribosomal protein L23
MARTKKQEVVATENAYKFPVATAADYAVILQPLVTEKSMRLMQTENKFTLKVAKQANAIQIKQAFEAIFNKKVEKVNVAHVRAKTKRVGKYSGLTSAYKKAIVTLAKGETLDLFSENK